MKKEEGRYIKEIYLFTKQNETKQMEGNFKSFVCERQKQVRKHKRMRLNHILIMLF